MLVPDTHGAVKIETGERVRLEATRRDGTQACYTYVRPCDQQTFVDMSALSRQAGLLPVSCSGRSFTISRMAGEDPAMIRLSNIFKPANGIGQEETAVTRHRARPKAMLPAPEAFRSALLSVGLAFGLASAARGQPPLTYIMSIASLGAPEDALIERVLYRSLVDAARAKVIKRFDSDDKATVLAWNGWRITIRITQTAGGFPVLGRQDDRRPVAAVTMMPLWASGATAADLSLWQQYIRDDPAAETLMDRSPIAVLANVRGNMAPLAMRDIVDLLACQPGHRVQVPPQNGPLDVVVAHDVREALAWALSRTPGKCTGAIRLEFGTDGQVRDYVAKHQGALGFVLGTEHHLEENDLRGLEVGCAPGEMTTPGNLAYPLVSELYLYRLPHTLESPGDAANAVLDELTSDEQPLGISAANEEVPDGERHPPRLRSNQDVPGGSDWTRLDWPIVFDTDKDRLEPAARRTICRMASWLRTQDFTGILLRGHADREGAESHEAHNQSLSRRRCEAVGNALQTDIGALLAVRVEFFGSETAASSGDKDKMTLDRRVDVWVRGLRRRRPTAAADAK